MLFFAESTPKPRVMLSWLLSYVIPGVYTKCFVYTSTIGFLRSIGGSPWIYCFLIQTTGRPNGDKLSESQTNFSF